MSGITKRFGGVLANDDAGLSVDRGEILALLGENGSGKSTLVNVLAGIYTPDSGSIAVNGKHCAFGSPHNAIAEGIGMVHQHFKLIPVMNAWENISLGSPPADSPPAGGARADRPLAGCGFFDNFISANIINKNVINKKIGQLEERFGLTVDHDKKVYDMPVGEKQTVEILKMLYRGASALILDEPTAVLTPQETRRLFSMLTVMKQEGCAVIIITHKLNEVMEISDRVTVMRKGKTIATAATRATSARELTGMMVGASVSLEIKRTEPPARVGEPVMQVENLSFVDAEKKRLLDNVSFDLYGGEILGVAGIAGSGQRELCEIIAGLRKATAGGARCRGKSILGLSPRQIRKSGVVMSFVPEDRLGMGLAGGMSVTDNILLRSYGLNPGIFVDRAGGSELAAKIIERYAIATPSARHMVRKLSGGNIQKVLLGREIHAAPSVLITAYPVRGLDIGASYGVYDLLNEEKKSGVAILYIGEDLDVLRELCDRLMVIHAGTVMGVVDPRAVSKEEIGLMMLGEKAA